MKNKLDIKDSKSEDEMLKNILLGQALCGILSKHGYFLQTDNINNSLPPHECAEVCYQYVDAIMNFHKEKRRKEIENKRMEKRRQLNLVNGPQERR